MTHPNAPLTPAGRHRLVTRVIAGSKPIPSYRDDAILQIEAGSALRAEQDRLSPLVIPT